MKNLIFIFSIILTGIFVLLTVWDYKKGDYLAEHDLWFMEKDFQQICTHIPGISENTLTIFINKCHNFVDKYPRSGTRGEVQKLMDNAITLKKAMEMPSSNSL